MATPPANQYRLGIECQVGDWVVGQLEGSSRTVAGEVIFQFPGNLVVAFASGEDITGRTGVAGPRYSTSEGRTILAAPDIGWMKPGDVSLIHRP